MEPVPAGDYWARDRLDAWAAATQRPHLERLGLVDLLVALVAALVVAFVSGGEAAMSHLVWEVTVFVAVLVLLPLVAFMGYALFIVPPRMYERLAVAYREARKEIQEHCDAAREAREQVAEIKEKTRLLREMDERMRGSPEWALCIEPPTLPQQTIMGRWEGDAISFRVSAFVRHKWVGDMNLSHWEVQPRINQQKLVLVQSNRHESIQPCSARPLDADVTWMPTAAEAAQHHIRKDRVSYFDCGTEWLLTCGGNPPQRTGSIPFQVVVPPVSGRDYADVVMTVLRELDRVRQTAVALVQDESRIPRPVEAAVNRQSHVITMYGDDVGQLQGCETVSLTASQSKALGFALALFGNDSTGWLLRDGHVETQPARLPAP